MGVFSAFKGSDNEKVSMMRVLTFMVVGVILAVYVYQNIRAGSYVSIGYQEGIIILGALGIKAYQAKVENSESGSTPVVSTTDAVPTNKTE